MSAVWSNYCFNTKIRPPFCFRQFGRSADIFVNYVELVFVFFGGFSLTRTLLVEYMYLFCNK